MRFVDTDHDIDSSTQFAYCHVFACPSYFLVSHLSLIFHNSHNNSLSLLGLLVSHFSSLLACFSSLLVSHIIIVLCITACQSKIIVILRLRSVTRSSQALAGENLYALPFPSHQVMLHYHEGKGWTTASWKYLHDEIEELRGTNCEISGPTSKKKWQ